MGCFSTETLGNVLANPLDPPNPLNPFGQNIHLTDNPIPAPGAGDAGTDTSGNQLGGSGTDPAATNNPSGMSLSDIIGQSLGTILKYQPDLYNAYAKYAPQYVGSNVQSLGQSLFGPSFSGNLTDINSGLTNLANQQTVASNTALRTGNQADIANLAPGALAQLQQLNPGLYASLAGQSAAAGRGLSPVSNPTLDSLVQRSQGTGIDSLLAQQNKIVGDQLALGGQLTPDQLRSVQQSSRAGFAARGLDATNASVVDEALQTQAAQQAMLQQRLSQAGVVEGQNQQAQNLQNALGINTAGLALNTAGQNAAIQNLGFGQGQQAFNNYANTAFNPYSSILGASSQNQGLNQSLFGNAYGVSSQSNPGVMAQLNPFNSFAQDYYNTQLSAQTNKDIAGANTKAGEISGGVSAAGALGGAALAAGCFCWVAREVYGTNDGRWLLFRYWLLEYAPRWFFSAYAAFGERFARFIHNKPRLKARIRIWMDARISSLPDTCPYSYSSSHNPAS